MIPRYSTNSMSQLWSEKTKFNVMLQIETLICEKLAQMGEIPKSVVPALKKIKEINVDRIETLEGWTKHDVVAFLTWINEELGEKGSYVHKGVTSSDITDTCLSVRLASAVTILEEDLNYLLENLKILCFKWRNRLCIGRTHGIQAEPTTFGLKMTSFYAEFQRNKKRLQQAKEEIRVCSISGAVGNYRTISPEVEKHVAKKLRLRVEDVATQVIPRDRHAVLLSVIGIIASSIERFVTEIRHLQRTEVGEVQESFEASQIGSSAMPHKRNPIQSENLTGISRILRSYVNPALENIVLWHERDISHSSVERIIIPDATTLLDYALLRLTSLVQGLVVKPEKMLDNLHSQNGLIFSQDLMLALVNKGISKETAYKGIKHLAEVSFSLGSSFKMTIYRDNQISEVLSHKELDKIFNPDSCKQNLDVIYDRVFKEEEDDV